VLGWISATLREPITFELFLHRGLQGAALSDFLPPTFKTAIFGLIIGLVACFQGMRTSGGTAGVGRSATSSVVLSSLFIILADVILVRVIEVFFPA
jgi:phospholipid/cholesterol/gamma-HCH transport system permease protein